MPIKQEVAQALTDNWEIGLFETPCKAPGQFCYGCCCCCGICMAAQQRLEILDVIQEPYVCCGGLCPCGPLGQPQDRNCVYAEVCCCLGHAVAGNRFLMQTRFNLMNTPCDDCILWTVCLASWLTCIMQMVGCDLGDDLANCVDMMVLIVNGCMLAQHQTQLEAIKRNGGYQGPPQHVLGMMDPFQQQVMMQGKPQQQQMGGHPQVVQGQVVGQPYHPGGQPQQPGW
mmetsp:Transcript_89339/g.193379  ORF Transcript_89339/g.193379 Transcript_89339/m.193379 type:complete len:227 (+) Transcript_89339:127-807(+)